MDVPELKRLRDRLRDLPHDFAWDFEECQGCALALLFGVEEVAFFGDPFAAAAERLGIRRAEASDLFGSGVVPVGMDWTKVTPEMVAAGIDKFLAEHGMAAP